MLQLPTGLCTANAALGTVDKPAGVDDHRVRTGGCLQQRMPRIAAQSHHLLCIHQILGTAKGNKCNLHASDTSFTEILAFLFAFLQS